MVQPSINCELDALRARGRIGLSVDNARGITRRARVHESGSLRVRFPNGSCDELEAVLVNTAGGMTGGDIFDIEISVAKNARLIVTGTTAEKVYRSLGPPVAVSAKLDVAAGAMLTWLPQETILFDKAALNRRIEVDLVDNARLVLIEPIVFGRTGMGEAVRSGELRDRWRVRHNGRLIYAESTRLGGPIAEDLGCEAIAKGAVTIATALIVPANETLADAIHALNEEFRGEVGISVWHGRAVLRFCARDGAALRHDIAAVLRVIRAAPLPRVWAN